MAEAQANVMVKDATPKKVMALASRKYSRDEKIKKDEEELEQLIAENKGEVKEEAQEQEPEPTSAEEKTFKKRYGDLRRHAQQKEADLQEQINQLKEQLDSATKKQIELPKSDEDIEAWTKKYPDVAGIVEAIADKKAQERSLDIDKRLKEVEELRVNAKREKAEAELLSIHPDFQEIRADDEFHGWAKAQPKWVQDALYENVDDAKSVARVIDLYKADNNITTKKRDTSDKDAAKAVKARVRNTPETDESRTYLRESEVKKMSTREYEKRSDEIMEAIRSGKFIYDLSK